MRVWQFVARCILISLASCAPAAWGGDWPHWGGTDGGNMVSDAKNLPDTFEPGKKKTDGSGIDMTTTKNVKWVAPLGSAAYGNPTVAGGRVYVGTDDMSVTEDKRFERTRGGLVKCFDEATGKLLWQLVVRERKNVSPVFLYGHQYLGTCSSPAIDGDRVYVVTNDASVLCLDVNGQANGNDGPFTDEAQYMAGAGKSPIKLNEKDADIIWRLDLIKDVGIAPHDTPSCSILVDSDLLYLSSSNGVDKPHLKVLEPEAPAFIAVDKRTGKVVAREGEQLSRRLFHCQWSSPSKGKVGDKMLVFVGGSDGWCYAFEARPDGQTLKTAWKCDCNIPEYRLGPDGKPRDYLAGDKRKKNSPNKNDGTFVGPSDIIATPVFHNNRVYVALGQDPAHGRGKGMFTCIDATRSGDITQTGKIWTYGGMDRTIATAAIADGLVYITDVAGRLHCLDADTGKPYWVYDTKAETWGSPLVADGKVYFGNVKAFYVMAAGKEAKLLNQINLGSPVYSTPIVANGVLYVASQRYLWAVK